MQVTLVDNAASDLKCVNAARISYNSSHEELTEGDKKLINAMVREGHGSVFEHSTFTFAIEAPIAVIREWQRHRIGHSYNELSGRYTEIGPDFCTPRPRVQKGKSMQYFYDDTGKADGAAAVNLIDTAYRMSHMTYRKLLELGIAKEVARYVLPLGTYTRMYWTCNARSLMHFLELRTSSQAMEEIRLCALKAEDIFREIMPVTHKACDDNGRKAP